MFTHTVELVLYSAQVRLAHLHQAETAASMRPSCNEMFNSSCLAGALRRLRTHTSATSAVMAATDVTDTTGMSQALRCLGVTGPVLHENPGSAHIPKSILSK